MGYKWREGRPGVQGARGVQVEVEVDSNAKKILDAFNSVNRGFAVLQAVIADENASRVVEADMAQAKKAMARLRLAVAPFVMPMDEEDET